MVHYDVKLSNFLLYETPQRGATYSLPWGRYSTPAVNGREWLVKLSDFGTAEISQTGEISVGQFTTLENTPIFCLLESKPPRGPHCDRWGLGLSLLHLLTGQVPSWRSGFVT